MAATPASAQRPSRHGRLSSGKKVATPAQTKSAVISPEAEKPKDAHTAKAPTEPVAAKQDTRSGAEIGIKKEEEVSSVDANQQPSAQSSTDSQVQPRRSMTRTRKPSSRLMPSPSPPPSRSSSSYYKMASSTASLATATTNNTSNGGMSTTKAPQKKQTTATTTTAFSVPSEDTSETITAEQSQDKEFGPGKRKRRPSTMSKPPSTITKQAAPSVTAQQPAGSTSASTGASLKVRISRVPSKSQTPEEKVHSAREKTTQSKKIKSESVNNQGSLTRSTLPEEDGLKGKATSGYESEGDAKAARQISLAEPEEHDRDEESDAGHVNKATRKIVIGRNKAGKDKLNVRRWPSSGLMCSSNSAMHALEPPPLISRRGGLKQHASTQNGLHKPHKPSIGDMGGHLRSQSTSVLDGKWAWTPSAIAPTLRFRLACHTNDDDSSEVSDMDDEDDFHVAMLDGGDFSEAHHRKAASLSSKDSHRDSKSGEDSDPEDTPATTPRSPQSTCELPERRWSTGADEEEKDSRKTARDSVFAHALEPSSHRPHTHAGALTLSLPFDEMSQGAEEDSSEGSGKPIAVAGVENDVADENSTATVLMSPAVHHSILGISSKQHALLLSSPQANSTFASPSLEATTSTPGDQSSRAEPAPLTLPAAATSSTLASSAAREKEPIGAEYNEDHSSPISGLHSSDEEEEAEMFTQTRLALEPPESMCLSELDRAWEQNEYLYKARSMAGGRVEEIVDPAPVAVDEGTERTNRPAKRGAKRASLVMPDEAMEEKETKKIKTPSKTQSVATPSPARRSKRQSGSRV